MLYEFIECLHLPELLEPPHSPCWMGGQLFCLLCEWRNQGPGWGRAVGQVNRGPLTLNVVERQQHLVFPSGAVPAAGICWWVTAKCFIAQTSVNCNDGSDTRTYANILSSPGWNPQIQGNCNCRDPDRTLSVLYLECGMLILHTHPVLTKGDGHDLSAM